MNIFIDTSIIIQENYLNGKKLNRLGVLSNQGFIKLYFTSVVDKEIKKNMKSECENLFQAEKTFKRQLETKHRILKNFYNIDDLSTFSDYYFNYEIYQKFERFVEFAKIEIINPVENFEISEIINNYFDSSPPFDNINKKNEFPDAISFKIAEDFLKAKKIKGIYLTSDSDFENMNSDFLSIKNDLNELLEEIITENNPNIFDDKLHIINSIKDDLDLFIPQIASEIELDSMIYHTDKFEKYDLKISIESQETEKLEVNYLEVFDITENLIGFKCKGTFETNVYYLLGENTNKETHDKILIIENLNLKKEGFVTYKGDFETSIYYEFEFPYKVIEESIEIDEEKAIRNIESI
jgi:hypothetical protein